MISEFTKEKVFWTRKMNLKLVKFIQSKPNIWNPKHPKYTSTKHRDKTYAEFASKYGNEFTGQAVKDRWTNIRSTFANYLRKLHSSRAIPDGEEYKVNWHLWEACQFLLKVQKKAQSETTDIENKEDEDSVPAKEVDWSSEENFSENNSINYFDAKCNTIVTNLVKVFKGVQNDAFGLDNTKNGKIGRAVSKKLSQMNSYDAAKASRSILDILLWYDKNNPNNPINAIKTEF